MTISELAKACGVGVETIRYYERRKLIPDPRPGKVGYREFGRDDLRRVNFIRQAQGLGFTLKQIAELLALRVSTESTCDDVRDLAEVKLGEIEEKIATLKSFKRALSQLVGQCGRTSPASQCPIIDALEDPQPKPKAKPKAKPKPKKRVRSSS
ncbi:MAG: MerR family DNA-binding protein [Planctomycetes bacterium]|nr:MerR family DNA-binding protein [Planctomycetota bacterium]